MRPLDVVVLCSYWGDAVHTASAMVEDAGTLWMHTGDEGIIDEEGYLSSESFVESNSV